VLATSSGDRTILAALSTGKYHKLDGVGASVWSALDGRKDVCEIVDGIHADWSDRVSYAQLDADVRILLVALACAGLICRNGPEPARLSNEIDEQSEGATVGTRVKLPAKPPSTLRCFTSLVLIDLTLRVLGFRRTMRLLCRRRCGQIGVPVPNAWATMMATNVGRAVALYPVRTLCLQQSLGAALALRSMRLDAQLRLGVRLHPFKAHAWVELGGVPVNDSPDRIQPFWPFPNFGLNDL